MGEVKTDSTYELFMLFECWSSTYIIGFHSQVTISFLASSQINIIPYVTLIHFASYKDISVRPINIILDTTLIQIYFYLFITMSLQTTHYQPYAKQHEKPEGPGDARPTGLQVIEDNGLVGKLSDKVLIITGCTAGLGIETTRSLHATGAKLFLTVRNKEKGEAVIQDILKTSQGKGSIEPTCSARLTRISRLAD
jgi:hypothetical protein